MNEYNDLYKILDKEKVSISELRMLTDSELVSSVSPAQSDKVLYYKYDVKLSNGELYYVFVKKSVWEILNLAKARQI